VTELRAGNAGARRSSGLAYTPPMNGRAIPAPPAELKGTTVLARLLDGLAFRFHWATEGLRAEDHAFRPGPDSMSTHELIDHVLQLVFMVKQAVWNAEARERIRSDDPEALRGHVLEQLALVRERLGTLEDHELATHVVLRRRDERHPVWNVLNGPLADALTHVGQISAWRRLSGNPSPRADVFAGRPPD
jgi:hypothetical protein